MSFRVGIGHDTHRLERGLPLRLGGVVIPHHSGLVGHSDADVLLHAVTDALLGATGNGDIGEWFSDTDPAHRDRDSGEMLRQVLARAIPPNAYIVNLDCTIFAQQPKLAEHKVTIRHSLAQLLGIDPGAVNVKAKTGEKVGPIGRQEAIDAEVIVLLAWQQGKAEDHECK